MIEHTVNDLEEILQIKMGYPFKLKEYCYDTGSIEVECVMLDTGKFIYNYGERWWEMSEERAKEMIDRTKGEVPWLDGFHRELE